MTGLFQNFLALITASIPLLIAISTFATNRTDATTQPIDIPAIKVLEIERHPISEETLQIIQKNYFIKGLVYALFFILLLIAQLYFFFNLEIFMQITIGIIALVTGIFFFFSYQKTYVSKVFTASQSRYFVFQSAKVVIEADFNYLFSKCLTILKNMKLKIIEVNEKKGIIEALQDNRGLIQILRIKIEKTQDLENVYGVSMDCEELSTDRYFKYMSNLAKIVSYGFPIKEKKPKLYRFVFENSKLINRFIDRLISKAKSTNGKDDGNGKSR